MDGREREAAGRKSRGDRSLWVDGQKDLQVRHPVWLVSGTYDTRAGRPGVLVEMMTAEMCVNDARAAVVTVMMLVEMRVNERCAQCPALERNGQPDRDQASKHGDIVAGSGIREPRSPIPY